MAKPAIIGEKALLKKLSGFKQSVVNKVGRQAIIKGNAVLKKSVKAQMHANTIRKKIVRKSIASKAKTYSKDGIIWGGVAVGVYKADITMKGVTFTRKIITGLAKIFEFGRPGIAPKPFLRTGLAKAKNDIISKMSQSIVTNVKKL